jgi:RHS repeat-associated protein
VLSLSKYSTFTQPTFGSAIESRAFASGGYRFGFNGMERDDEAKGAGNSYDFGARIYDNRLGSWLAVDPHFNSYTSFSPFFAFAANPLNVIDPDGRDIIVLRNSNGAKRTGHGAVLIGNEIDGWSYISKDGYTGSAFGSKPKYIVENFSSIEAFRNSPHNFVLADGTHSTEDGTAASSFNYKKDANGNKVQRYDMGLYIGTTQEDGTSTDAIAINAATKVAKEDYCLTMSDCSDVITAALNSSEDNDGDRIQNGEKPTGGLVAERPNAKFDKIKERNKKAVVYDDGLTPDDKQLKKDKNGSK